MTLPFSSLRMAVVTAAGQPEWQAGPDTETRLGQIAAEAKFPGLGGVRLSAGDAE
jgi:hypothetical protein